MATELIATCRLSISEKTFFGHGIWTTIEETRRNIITRYIIHRASTIHFLSFLIFETISNTIAAQLNFWRIRQVRPIVLIFVRWYLSGSPPFKSLRFQKLRWLFNILQMLINILIILSVNSLCLIYSLSTILVTIN